MATIHSISIKNFRGIKDFNQSFYNEKIICLVGRGDSGKSSILEAISYVLSSSWNITFFDSDFYNCDTSNPIEIETTLVDLPDFFINEKYGLHIRGINENGQITDDLQEEDINVKALTIKLTVKDDLEPTWELVSYRPHQQSLPLSASARAKLNVFLISDYTDRHFSWSKGNPLYALLKQESGDATDEQNIVLNALRKAKKEIDNNSFDDFKEVIKRVSVKATEFGIDVSNTTTSIDFKDISIKDNRVCLHDESNVPFRLKGKGAKRLISMAIQSSLAGNSSIMLVDEIEQGLEPDRVQHVVNTLKKKHNGQVFISTHSSNVVVELDAPDLFILKKGASNLKQADKSLQGCIRNNPAALFGKKLIICEGATEIGICRAINQFRISQYKTSASHNGVCFVDGTGSNFVDYCKGFISLGFDIHVFCDSDDKGINQKKEELRQLRAEIIDCETNNSIEQQFFNDLPWNGIQELLKYAIDKSELQAIESSIKAKNGNTLQLNWQNTDSTVLRPVLALVAKKNEWYKRIDHGQFLGDVLCKHLSEMDGKHLKAQFDSLTKFMD